MSIRDLSWQEQANCVGVPLEVFFPSEGVHGADAKRVCARCDVQAECFAYAMELEAGQPFKGRHGVYGGHSPNQRAEIAGERVRR